MKLNPGNKHLPRVGNNRPHVARTLRERRKAMAEASRKRNRNKA